MVASRGLVGRAFEQHRRALRYHCYQLLGSLADADDFAQEAIARALAAAETFAGRAELKTYLFRIATNACIDELRRRKRRKLVSTTPPSRPFDELAAPGDPEEWIQPFPDALLPDQHLARTQAVTLAFVAALQRLPARQRAVLVLRDSLDWSADETAKLLGMTAVAVNSSLVRARAQLRRHCGPVKHSPGRAEMATARRFAAAFARNDVATLTAMFREDVGVHMPPANTWLQGRDAVLGFLAHHIWPAGRFEGTVTRVNGLSGATVTLAGRPWAVVSLELDRSRRVATLHAFLFPHLLRWFGNTNPNPLRRRG